MRLWHKDLISSLPNQQLIAQWRELKAIKSKVEKCGTPNHLLVNYILNIKLEDWVMYCQEVYNELKIRGFKVKSENYEDVAKIKISGLDSICVYHDNKYLEICYYNLYEKFLRGGVPKIEWLKVNNKYHSLKMSCNL